MPPFTQASESQKRDFPPASCPREEGRAAFGVGPPWVDQSTTLKAQLVRGARGLQATADRGATMRNDVFEPLEEEPSENPDRGLSNPEVPEHSCCIPGHGD
jgi:hypothetical protein